VLMGGHRQYYRDVKALFGSSLVGYWTLGESSGTVAEDKSGNGYNGAYSNILQGEPSIGGQTLSSKFVPASSPVINLYSAGLAGAVNVNEFTIQFIMKAIDASWWAAATTSRQLTLAADASNRIICGIGGGVANTVVINWTAGGAVSQVTIGTSTLSPFVVTITGSKSNNRLRVYMNKAKQGADVAMGGTWAGALASNTTVIGAATSSGNFTHSGWMSNFFILNKEATQGEIDSAMPPLP